MAIVRLFLDSGMRLAELANLRLEDLEQDVAIVVGKGRRPRACPFGSKTGSAASFRSAAPARLSAAAALARHRLASRWAASAAE